MTDSLVWFVYRYRFPFTANSMKLPINAYISVLIDRTMKRILIPAIVMLLAVSCSTSDPAKEEWVALFNGHDLEGWTVKTAKHPVGENFNNTVRVEEGLLKMVYDDYQSFDGEFTHLFCNEKFSYYKLVVEYRFMGEQVTGGPSWATRNSGVMIHGQTPESMDINQSFPVSIEVQFLGGLGAGERPTSNLCTPGTNVEINGALHTQHCLNSTSKTYDGDVWVTTETIVHGNEQIWHIVEGDTVLTYQRPQLDPNDSQFGQMLEHFGSQMISEGTISLQGESGPVQFRTVKLLNLKGCMDPKAKNYKSYYISEDNSKCVY
jgi:hypothetical protein